MNISDSFFNKIEKKTNVKKSSILNLAKKLQGDNMKDEKTLREVIKELSSMTGKEVSKEQEDKIINTVINDKVPSNIDKSEEHPIPEFNNNNHGTNISNPYRENTEKITPIMNC